MQRKTILIVDDDSDLLLGLGIRLRSVGYQVIVAGDAISAVASAVKKEPHLILLDLGLPAGDGFLVLKRLKSLTATRSTPVIVVTARDDSFEERSLAAGAVAFFQKPVDNEDLFAAIAQQLEEVDRAANG